MVRTRRIQLPDCRSLPHLCLPSCTLGRRGGSAWLRNLVLDRQLGKLRYRRSLPAVPVRAWLAIGGVGAHHTAADVVLQPW